MIRSMTAFAAGERSTEWGVLSGELRAVNHRFLELGLRLPDELRAFETALRERVASRVARGKLDLVIRLRAPETDAGLHVNDGMVEALARLNLELTAKFPGLRTSLTELLQYPGVLRGRDADAEALQREALALLDAVLDDFTAAREREGGKLAQVIGERAEAIAGIAGDVRTLVPQIRAGQRSKLEARLADLSQPADPGRLEQELVIWLQKLDVDEELDRLDSHLVELRRILKGGKEPVGRRLDFLLQEFNREANTLGSKSAALELTAISVEMKVLVEQMREQVQNIE